MTPFIYQDIERDEGLSLTAYPDPISHGDPWTIGFGSTGRDIHKGTVWTPAYASIRCQQAIDHTHDALLHELPWFAGLSDPRQDVLVNMGYNLGVAGLLKFNLTLAAIEAGRYTEAANRMLRSKWAAEVHKRAKRLSDQMKTGERQP